MRYATKISHLRCEQPMIQLFFRTLAVQSIVAGGKFKLSQLPFLFVNVLSHWLKNYKHRRLVFSTIRIVKKAQVQKA